MILATVAASGRPSARTVLLKGLNEEGFIFYTNYLSKKGQELQSNPHAALVFLWKPMERQIRVEGVVEKIAPEDSDKYFNSRPEGSRIGAIASPQSSVVANREALNTMKAKAQEGALERPKHWGGYILKADLLEFWQGRPDRMHDRFQYSSEGALWKIDRLAP